MWIWIIDLQSLLNGPSKPQDKYTRLDNEVESANHRYIEDTQAQQQVQYEKNDKNARNV